VNGALFKKGLLNGKRHLSQDGVFVGGGIALCIHCSELDSKECGEFLV
jgi:hypothetical protein